MNVLISIKPEFVEKIISHEKMYEFRKSIFKKNPEKIFIYSTSPQREIVGYFKPSKIIHDSPVFPNPLKMINYTDFNAPQSFCYIENNKFLRQLLLKSF